MVEATRRPTVAVHKFSSCDGCQLAFLNLGESLLKLAQRVELVHFAEAGLLAEEDTAVDIAFVEGSLSTSEDLRRIERIRDNTRYLVTIGACATSGGLQALRNLAAGEDWPAQLYPHPEYIDSLADSQAVASRVKVDWALWGCPISTRQLLACIGSLLAGVSPEPVRDSLCLECKRAGHVCVLVSQAQPCLGPVTRAGCGALCPAYGRACYGCFGPAETANTEAIARRWRQQGLDEEAIARRFLFINSQAAAFHQAGLRWQGETTDER